VTTESEKRTSLIGREGAKGLLRGRRTKFARGKSPDSWNIFSEYKWQGVMLCFHHDMHGGLVGWVSVQELSFCVSFLIFEDPT